MIASRLLSFLILIIISLIYTCICLCSVVRFSVKIPGQYCTISVHFNSMTYFVFISKKSLKSIGSKSVLWPDFLWKLLAKTLLLWLVHCNSGADFVFISQKFLKNVDSNSVLWPDFLWKLLAKFVFFVLVHFTSVTDFLSNLFCDQIFSESCLPKFSYLYTGSFQCRDILSVHLKEDSKEYWHKISLSNFISNHQEFTDLQVEQIFLEL